MMRENREWQPGKPEDALISQAKAAEMCGMTRAAIQELVRRQRFRSAEVQGRDLVYLKEIEAFAKTRK